MCVMIMIVDTLTHTQYDRHRWSKLLDRLTLMMRGFSGRFSPTRSRCSGSSTISFSDDLGNLFADVLDSPALRRAHVLFDRASSGHVGSFCSLSYVQKRVGDREGRRERAGDRVGELFRILPFTSDIAARSYIYEICSNFFSNEFMR